ncbi:PE family protein [Mycobacterium haemophilum DSM 44634]|uniref:PE family protein n=1 Tax=Mycobacterium haemophilum TaxID=29311 RepID=UPI000654EFF4|nr:PE family protein [Mycobacterium haemophilum]AKN17108.1 PE family protein [Mycobacterium haemophilum DSM 44634]MCV7340549.1 PE family protein [Mycobacterium haemophilum DSM 44634]
MSFVFTYPEALATTAGHLSRVGSVMATQNTAAAAATTGLLPAAADAISALIATQFNAHGAMYQAASAQAMAVHELFVAILGASADSYAATEAANAIATS